MKNTLGFIQFLRNKIFSSIIMNNSKEYENCPERMGGGRHFTDYRPNSVLNDLIREQNKVDSNGSSYREFLQKNADQLLQKMNHHYQEKYACSKCKKEMNFSPDEEAFLFGERN